MTGTTKRYLSELVEPFSTRRVCTSGMEREGGVHCDVVEAEMPVQAKLPAGDPKNHRHVGAKKAGVAKTGMVGPQREIGRSCL